MNMLNLSIAVTAAAALVLLLKLLFGNKITPRGHMLLWLLPAVAMLAVPLARILPGERFCGQNLSAADAGTHRYVQRMGGTGRLS